MYQSDDLLRFPRQMSIFTVYRNVFSYSEIFIPRFLGMFINKALIPFGAVLLGWLRARLRNIDSSCAESSSHRLGSPLPTGRQPDFPLVFMWTIRNNSRGIHRFCCEETQLQMSLVVVAQCGTLRFIRVC
ncbi:hypothetical protein CEXT_621491 [Caerostris extrusa]|uniref:Uncharacterized protein n=1 Tax=Caerostris extrusa TaxID=172846 RepID=A0AAV4XB66_CAEEX|nr:hypothetical protein CEXT_621491 [Caerostris extrusa]